MSDLDIASLRQIEHLQRVSVATCWSIARRSRWCQIGFWRWIAMDASQAR